MAKVKKKDWQWFGDPAHYVLGHKCVFHLATRVGPWLISTVGDLREGDRLREVGIGRRYETMVFRIDGTCKCGCGLPHTDGREVKMYGYNTRGEATKGHMRVCELYSATEEDK